jgi:hypothetical protein
MNKQGIPAVPYKCISTSEPEWILCKIASGLQVIQQLTFVHVNTKSRLMLVLKRQRTNLRPHLR